MTTDNHTDLESRVVLNLHCGRKRRPDAVNLDVTGRTNPDVVHDLNVRPWPFPADRFDAVVAHDVLEHLDDTLAAMEEVYRVCRDGAIVDLVVPHFSSSNPSRIRRTAGFSADSRSITSTRRTT